MVRGKCIFAKIEDIIDAVKKIKRFIDTANLNSADSYRLIEVESRFTKKIPISDVTLKIVLKEEIVA